MGKGKTQFRPRLPLWFEPYSEAIKNNKLSEAEFFQLYGKAPNEVDTKAILLEKISVKPFKPKVKKQGKYETWLVFGCVHRPFHDKKLWAGLMNLMHELLPNLSGIIINGDYVDLLSLSAHAKFDTILPGINLGVEYKDGLDGLLEIESVLGKRKNQVKKIFHYGNHEDRYFRHIKGMDNAKYGNALISPVEGLRLHELGYEVQLDYQNGLTQLGEDLDVFHGHYFNQHAAKKHLDATNGKSVLFNHTHRFQMYSDGFHTGYNIGWLGDKGSKAFNYAPRFTKQGWTNGFAVVYVDADGQTMVNPVKCSGGRFFFGGRGY